MLRFVVVALLHVVGGIESLVMVPPLARDTRWCRRHLSHQLVASEFILRFVDWAILRISPCSIIDEATSWHPFSGIGNMSVVLGWNRGRRWAVVWYGISRLLVLGWTWRRFLLYNNVLVGKLMGYLGTCFSLESRDEPTPPYTLIV